MLNLTIPPALQEEFATVKAVWHSGAKTRRVDALMLSWVKYEKQLRRLFCFLVFQHPKIGRDQIDSVVTVLAENNSLYPETFIAGIAELDVISVEELLGQRFKELATEIARIKRYRNKLMHGQITGQNIRSPQLERDVLWIVDWTASLAESAEKEFGYDGFKRNTYSVARSASKIAVGKYPFATVAEFNVWISGLVKRVQKAARRP